MKLVRQILHSCHVSYLLAILSFIAFGPNESATQTDQKPR